MKRVALVVLGVLGSVGCAFNDIPLTLPERGLQEPIRGGEGRRIFVEVPFDDAREIRDRCGMQKNGYNMDTADAVCQSDPATWIATLLRDELRASGFEVLEPGEGLPPEAVRVEGRLIKLFVEPVIGFWTGSVEADLSVRLHATSGTGLDASRTFFVKGWKGGQLASTMQPYHTALDRATQKMLEEMVRAVIELLDRHPQLGLREPGALRVQAVAGGGRG